MDTMNVTVARAEQDDPHTARPGTWMFRNGKVLIICCCSAWLPIGEDPDYTILEDGSVEPEIVCSQCDWNIVAMLVGYRAATS